jgi:adenosylcobinamide kinase/adenosylcobinamide-phosphate guanylyltransferase
VVARPNRSRIVLVGGGARSGKSTFALARARQLGTRRLFLATARRYDAEMEERIARHRAERERDFETIEEPVALPEALLAATGHDVVVVDCLTLWLSNLLVDGVPVDEIERRVEELAAALGRAPAHVVLVTNEVGMGVHPESALGRAFRDLAGRAHQRLARAADEIHFAVLGVLVRLKPAPIEIHHPGDPA